MTDTAKYLHATLFEFAPNARDAVLCRFREMVGKSVDIRCSYDSTLHTFLLECPSDAGPAVDDALRRVITGFIKDEAANGMQRFRESEFDSIDAFSPRTTDPPASRASRQQQRSTQIVVSDASKATSVRLFRFHELPIAMIERTLAPKTNASCLSFTRGCTIRTVYWTSAGYVYGGNTENVDVVGQSPCPAVQLPPFTQLHDIRTGLKTAESSHGGDHSRDDGPTVERWLANIGQPVDPDDTAQMPKDAVGMFLSRSGDAPGRTRVAKGAQILSINDEVDTAVGNVCLEQPTFSSLFKSGSKPTVSNSVDAACSEQPTFSSLFESISQPAVSKPATNDGWRDQSSDPRNEVEVLLEDPSPHLVHEIVSFDSLLSGTQPLSKAPGLPHRSRRNEETPQVDYSPQVVQTALRSRPDIAFTSAACPSEIPNKADQEFFPSYGSRYAKIDEIGLHAPADGVDQPHIQRSRTSTAPLRARSPSKRTFVRSPADSTEGPTDRRDTQIDPRTNADVLTDEDKLDSGLTQGVKKSIQTTAQKRKKAKKSKSARGEVELPMSDPVPALTNKKAPNFSLHSSQVQHKQSAPVSSMHPMVKRSNMVQSTSSLLNRRYPFGAYLDADSLTTESVVEGSDEAFPLPSRSQRIIGHVGIVVLRVKEEEHGSQPCGAQHLEQKLNSESTVSKTDFLSRLTTSDIEAKLILDVATTHFHDRTSFVVYDIYVRDVNRVLHLVNVPGDCKEEYTVSPLPTEVVTAYLHFPSHVHDARIQVVSAEKQKEDSFIHHAMRETVKSMTTADDILPSFKAWCGTKDLVIERIVARQVLQMKSSSSNITIELAKNWDLVVTSVSNSMHNVHATARSEQAMKDEHRLWWDLRYETEDLASIGLLEQRVTEMVRAIDAVGQGNEGPWTRRSEPDIADTASLTEDAWFW